MALPGETHFPSVTVRREQSKPYEKIIRNQAGYDYQVGKASGKEGYNFTGEKAGSTIGPFVPSETFLRYQN
jgi:hypothetical protein